MMSSLSHFSKFSFSKIIMVYATMTAVVSIFFIGYLWISSNRSEFQKQAKLLRSLHIEKQKEKLKKEVTQALDFVIFMQSQADMRLKDSIKSRTNEAWAVMENIWQIKKDIASDEQIGQMIKQALEPIRFNKGRGYYFAFNRKGINTLFPVGPEMEGKNMMQVKGGNGERVVPDMLDIVKKDGQGFYEYMWTKPDREGYFLKIAFVKVFEPLGWVIGTGEYMDDVESDIQEECIKWISNIRFDNDNYVFAGQWDGLSLSGPQAGKNMFDVQDANGVKIVQQLIESAKSGGGFVHYILPQFEGKKHSLKISYAAGVPRWKWYVGAGAYVDDIEVQIALKQKELDQKIKKNIRDILFVLFSLLSVVMMVVVFLSTRIRNNLVRFERFFNLAAAKSVRIDKEQLYFKEFFSLAQSANDMVEKRWQAQQSLEEIEQQFKLITDHTSSLVSIHDADTNYIFVSPSHKQIGYKPEELIGKSCFTIMEKQDIHLLENHLEKAKKKLLSQAFIKYRLIDKKGKQHYFHGSFDAVFKSDGQLDTIICVGEDITRLRQAQLDKLEALSLAAETKKFALVGQIAGKLAHDFNNVLGAVMGNTELALLECTQKETRHYLKLIFEQTLRGRNLTKNLVAFAKDQEPRQEYFLVDEKIELVISLMKKDLGDIDMVREYSQKVPQLLADPGMIEHALVNLLQNSIHAVSLVSAPQIIIRTRCSDDQVCIEIEDNGCGIPKEAMEKIFEPSFTLKGSRDILGDYKAGIKGTGYGMSNVKKYIDQHRGKLFIHSEPGSGTTVSMMLPVIKKQLSAREVSVIDAQCRSFGKHILLVEDEPTISDVQYRILTQKPCNHKVDVARTGQMAKDLFDRNTYDLVSLDYILGGDINGMDVYYHIRKTSWDIPILFISGNIEFIESIKALKQKDKHIDHVSKPCRNMDYINCINALFEIQKREKEQGLFS